MGIYDSKTEPRKLVKAEFKADDIWEVYGLETNLTDKEIAILIEKTDWHKIEEKMCKLFWKMAWEDGERLGFDMEA